MTLGQPQIMIRHPRNDVGLSNKMDAPRSEDGVRSVDVVVSSDDDFGSVATWWLLIGFYNTSGTVRRIVHQSCCRQILDGLPE
jgi:hypothetical protein